MLHHTSLPEVEKVSKFNQVAPLIEKMAKFGFICQGISFISESYGTGNFIYNDTLSFLAPPLAFLLALSIALPISLVIEYAVYELVIFCTSCLAKGDFLSNSGKYKVLFLIAFTVLSAATITSVFLSKKSITFAFTHKDIKEKIDIGVIEGQRKIDLEKIENRLMDQSKEDGRLSDKRKDNINQKYKALIDAQNLELSVWERKEKREKKSYTTRKLIVKKKIADLEKSKAEDLLDYNNGLLAHNRDFSDLLKGELKVINDKYDTKIKAANASNSQNEQTRKEVNSWFAFFLRNIAGLSVIGFITSRVWVQLAYEEAGIRRKNYYTPSFFESSVLEDVMMFLKLLVIRWIQNPIRSYIKSSPTLLKLEDSGKFVDLKEHKEEIDRIKAEAEQEAKIKKQEAKAAQEELIRLKKEKEERLKSETKKSEANTYRIKEGKSVRKRKKESEEKKVMKQKVLKFYQNHKKENNGKKPTQQLMADTFGITTRTIYEYMKELREESLIG